MDATCAIQASIHVFSLVRKYVSRILGTYQRISGVFLLYKKCAKKYPEALADFRVSYFQVVN